MNLRGLEVVTFVVFFGWLLTAAALVGVEYYDGYDTISNARHFLGRTEAYVPTRGPLFGALLVPSQWIQEQMGLHPLEVRGHHLVFAVLHAAYLLGSYLFLRRCFGGSVATWLAFVASVPTFLFFTYARTISHDLFPGLVFLALLLGTRDFMNRSLGLPPGQGVRFPLSFAGLWSALVVLGAAAALIKHTYAVFWIVVLGVEALLILWPGSKPGSRREAKPDRARQIRALAQLVLAALCSGLITVLILGLVLSSHFPELGFFARLERQVEFLLFEAGVQSQTQPAWVYLRNAPAFGLLPWLLLPFGLVLSWRGSTLQRAFVIAWLLCVLLIHVFSLRQVRYLAFLAPITAALLIPALEAAAERLRSPRPVWMAAAAVVLLAWVPGHAYSIGEEALRIFQPFYRSSAARTFLKPLEDTNYAARPIYVNWGLLSFPAPGEAALAGDIYHELYHLAPQHLVDLFPYQSEDVVVFDPSSLSGWQNWPPRIVLITTTHGPVFNETTWNRQPARNRAEQTQSIFIAQTLTVQPGPGAEWPTDTGTSLRVTPLGSGAGAVLVLEGSDLVHELHPAMPMRATIGGQSFPLRVLAEGRWGIAGIEADRLGRSGRSLDLHFFETAAVHRNETAPVDE